MAGVTDVLLGEAPSLFYVGDRLVVAAAVGGMPVAPPPLGGFPTDTGVGIDSIEGWEPATVVEEEAGYIELNDEDAVFEDYEFIDTYLLVKAPNITFRRCNFIGQAIMNADGISAYVGNVANGMVLEDCTIRCIPPGNSVDAGASMIGEAGFTMTRCSLLDVNEGVRIGASQWTLLDPTHPLGTDVNITDCYIRIIAPNPYPPGFDWHGDCFQASDTGVLGEGLTCTIRNSVFICDNSGAVGGNSAIISGPGHSLPFDIDGLIMAGGGYTFYNRVGGDYSNIYFVDGSQAFAPILTDVPTAWGLTTTWDNVKVCTLDGAGQPDEIIGTIPLGWDGGAFDPP